MSTPDDWYRLFSRGALDWLRHNCKVREAVRAHLPELAAGPDLISGAPERTVQVPVRLLEHARFRLADGRLDSGIGQGPGAPGDVMAPFTGPGGAGGNAPGELRLVLEFAIDDIMDWFWEELRLPRLEPLPGARADQPDLVREGWDRHGARARLDRRRTLREAMRRRVLQPGGAAFVNDDLRFRQVVARPRQAVRAVLFLALDVSASMGEAERRQAKTFFFYAVQGLRRRYHEIAVRFIAHTTEAWEFGEADFFEMRGSGGTCASSAFRLALKIAQVDYPGGSHNLYLFYASDGENFSEDWAAAGAALTDLGRLCRALGYLETVPAAPGTQDTEMRRLCNELTRKGTPVPWNVVASADDVWTALRRFFVAEAAGAAA